MDPISLVAGGGILSTAIGGVTSAYGAEYTAQAQANQLRFQAGLAQQRAAIDEANARFAQNAGEVNALREGLRGRFQRESLVAEAGASQVAGGSKAAVFAGQTYATQLDESISRTDAARRQTSALVQASAEHAQAGADIIGAQVARRAGDVSALGTLLTAGGKVADQWMQASTAGVKFNYGDQVQDYFQDIEEG